MESYLKEKLNSSKLERMGRGGGGCISQGEGYFTDQGGIYLKSNGKWDAREMFEGEFAGLEAMQATETVRVPKPIKVIDNPVKGEGAFLAMEYLDMSSLSTHSSELGTKLAEMHLHNRNKALNEDSKNICKPQIPDRVSKFGFHITTYCGAIPLDNNWSDDWVSFYASLRLQKQFDKIAKEYRDKEAMELWSLLQIKIPKFFEGIEIQPSLLHGDLWSGNAAEISTEAIVFDPACFYGHDEFELAITGMFGAFNGKFYKAYHDLIPKQPGFSERKDLYQLFHYLNHWNHFGTSYRGSTISALKRLTK